MDSYLKQRNQACSERVWLHYRKFMAHSQTHTCLPSTVITFRSVSSSRFMLIYDFSVRDLWFFTKRRAWAHSQPVHEAKFLFKRYKWIRLWWGRACYAPTASAHVWNTAFSMCIAVIWGINTSVDGKVWSHGEWHPYIHFWALFSPLVWKCRHTYRESCLLHDSKYLYALVCISTYLSVVH